MPLSPTHQFEHRERQGGCDQYDADDRVLGVLDRRAKLKPDDDDYAAQDRRNEYMRDAGQAGEPGDAGERAACASRPRAGSSGRA
jgi:hypothetical protein